MPPTVERVAPARTADVVSVMCDAFHGYPVMRYVVGMGHDDFDDHLLRLIDYFVFRRVRHGAPLLGIMDDGDLVAAATVTLPVEPEMPADVAVRRDDLWRDLGDDARRRYEAYSAATKAFAIDRPHYHLNMIGVRRRHAGTGLARPLLDAVARMSRDSPESCGVSLTTENSANLTLYEHFGYRVIGHARVSPELETWGLFLTTGARAKAE